MVIAIILFVSGTAALSLVWMYFINIYEVKYVTSNEILFADNNSRLSIDVVPINAFGQRALLRSVEADFYIEKGSHLIDIISDKRSTERFTIKSRKEQGKVVVLIKCDKAYLPVKVEIPVCVKNRENSL
jgi:hypothetical protein